jgi:hypothetical protein
MATLSSGLKLSFAGRGRSIYRKFRPASDRNASALANSASPWRECLQWHSQSGWPDPGHGSLALVHHFGHRSRAGRCFSTGLSQRPREWQGAYAGIAANLAFTGWATLTLNGGEVLDLGRFNFPFHGLPSAPLGMLCWWLLGYLTSFLFPVPQHASGNDALGLEAQARDADVNHAGGRR